MNSLDQNFYCFIQMFQLLKDYMPVLAALQIINDNAILSMPYSVIKKNISNCKIEGINSIPTLLPYGNKDKLWFF